MVFDFVLQSTSQALLYSDWRNKKKITVIIQNVLFYIRGKNKLLKIRQETEITKNKNNNIENIGSKCVHVALKSVIT